MGLFSKKYKWDGYWETGYFFKILNSDEEVDIRFEDELSDTSNPEESQINIVTYIINNQVKILDALCQAFLSEYDKWKEIYEEHLPEMKSVNDVKEHIEITTIYVDLPEKEGLSYVGYSGRCSWDDEHGIGFYAHKLSVLEVGDSSTGFSGAWIAYKDLGIEEQIELQIEENKKNPKRPKRYEAHPIYGLKPSQEDANKGYYYHLIERGFNETFIDHFNQGDINTDTRTGYVNMSFLERACQSNNHEIVEFLLSKKPIETKGCLKQACYNLNLPIIKLLFNYGMDINEQDDWFEDYPIQNAVSSIATLVRNNKPKEDYFKGLEVLKWMLEHGAKPGFVLNPANDYDQLEHSFEDEKIREEVKAILEGYSD